MYLPMYRYVLLLYIITVGPEGRTTKFTTGFDQHDVTGGCGGGPAAAALKGRPTSDRDNNIAIIIMTMCS